jgi:hypothetical protein
MLPFLITLAYVGGRIPDAVDTKAQRLLTRVCQFAMFAIFFLGFVGFFILHLK